jgi:hypothetical protein
MGWGKGCTHLSPGQARCSCAPFTEAREEANQAAFIWTPALWSLNEPASRASRLRKRFQQQGTTFFWMEHHTKEADSSPE